MHYLKRHWRQIRAYFDPVEKRKREERKKTEAMAQLLDNNEKLDQTKSNIDQSASPGVGESGNA